MDENFNIEPPKGLLEEIFKRIHKEELFLVLRRTVIFSITLVASLVGFIPSLKVLIYDFSQTGFINFFSLVFSDFSSVITYWQSFSIILLETLPILSLALFLAVVLTMLQSIKSLTRNVKIIKTHHLMAN